MGGVTGVHVLDRGAGPAAPLMVLVHGLEATPTGWTRFATRWTHNWRVRALDLPWRAGGEHGWRRDGTAGAWLARALADLGEVPTALVGHSFGANAVLDLLATAPTAPAHAAVLVSPFYCPADYPVTWTLFDQARVNFDATINAGLSTWLARRMPTVDEAVLTSMSRTVRDRVGPVAFTTWFEHFVASGQLPLAAIDVPTLALSGRDDTCLGEKRAAALAAAMPSLRLELFDDYDHFCHIKQAARVAERVARFLPDATRNAGLGAIEAGSVTDDALLSAEEET